jgi:3-phenylpropionate/cinnamic acid dioxygenase small subunit
VLREGPQGWRIASKKVVLMNDTIPTMLDFYCV